MTSHILVIASIHQVFHEFFYIAEELGKPYISFDIINAEEVDLNKWTTQDLQKYQGIWIHNSRQDFQECHKKFLSCINRTFKGITINTRGESSRVINSQRWKELGILAPSIIELTKDIRTEKDIPFPPPYILRRKVGHQKDVTDDGGRLSLPRIKLETFSELTSHHQQYYNTAGEYLLEEFINTQTSSASLFESWRIAFLENEIYSFSKRQQKEWLVRTTENACISPIIPPAFYKQLSDIIQSSGFTVGLIDFGVSFQGQHIIPWEVTPAIKFEFYEYTPYNYASPSHAIQKAMYSHVFHLLGIPCKMTPEVYRRAINEVQKRSWT